MAMSAIGIVLFNDRSRRSTRAIAAVRELAAGLLLMAAIFQLSDGVQVGAAGALRGFKDTADPDDDVHLLVLGRRLSARLRVRRAQRRRPACTCGSASSRASRSAPCCSSAAICTCRGDRCRRRRWKPACCDSRSRASRSRRPGRRRTASRASACRGRSCRSRFPPGFRRSRRRRNERCGRRQLKYGRRRIERVWTSVGSPQNCRTLERGSPSLTQPAAAAHGVGAGRGREARSRAVRAEETRARMTSLCRLAD